MKQTHINMIVCLADGQNAEAAKAARVAEDIDGACSVVEIRAGGGQIASLKALEPDSAVLLLSPGAAPDKRTIAAARDVIQQKGYAAILGSAMHDGGDSFSRLADIDLALRHQQIAQRENLPVDPSCAVFTPEAFRLVSRGGDVCGLDNVHELACALWAMGHEVGFAPALRARCKAPGNWRETASCFVGQGEQFARRLAGVGGMDLEKRPWLPGAAWEALLMLAAAGFAGFALFHDTAGNLIRALICLLLLYPVNRRFLKQVSETAPELMNKALLYCLLRAPCRTGGLLKSAFLRLIGS